MKITAITDEIIQDVTNWSNIGRKILAHYDCPENYIGIGKCIEFWKKDKAIAETEMVNGLGFLFGTMLFDDHSGSWVQIEDDFGKTLALEVKPQVNFFVLDVISKRLRDDSRAEEIQSLADYYRDECKKIDRAI